jgi:hypothetical protein
MQREAWQSMPIGYESESNQMVDIPSTAPEEKAMYVKAATLSSSLRQQKWKSSLSRQSWRQDST